MHSQWRPTGVGVAAAVSAAALYGLIAGRWTPRGPITAVDAVTTIGVSLLVGALAGLAMRSRWAMFLGPVAFAGVFELTRWGIAGPLVDGIHLNGTYGTLAFALGRGLHGLLALAPMALGAVLGAGLAHRRDDTDRARHGWGAARLGVRRTVTVLIAVSLIALTAGIVRPARTDPVLAADGTVLPGSVAELTRVEIGGHQLSMMIRGDSVDNPVLLYLSGGPGGSDIGGLRRNSEGLEHSFVVATVDQRGAGKSYDALDPLTTLTLATAISDVVEVTNYLRARFHQTTIYLVGNSWGSLVGVLAAQQYPELFAAFVGAGQMVDPRATDRLYYQDTLAWAERTGATEVARQLTRNGPPPYADPLKYEPVLGNEQEVYAYDDSGLAEGANGFSENLFHDEYSLMEQAHLFAGFLDTFVALYPQLQEIDFRTQVTRLEIPVYLVQGGHETRARAEPAAEWFQLLQAPTKKLVVFERAGHRTLFQEPDRFERLMSQVLHGQEVTG